MAQLTIYLDEATLRQVVSAAKREHASTSQWVKKRLAASLHGTWPARYFELFGALAQDDTFRRPPQPSWGSMLSSTGRAFMEQAPWLAIFPGLAISLAVLGFNLFGDTLRDVWDPKLRGRS